MEASTSYFISLVECNHILYNKSLKDFKNVKKKEEAWSRIAKLSNLTADSAKKRYASLRQKYCREKQKIEIQRRTKSNPGRPWIYFERLRFLDDFIQPRSTYTNDAGYIDEIGYGNVNRIGDDGSMTLAEGYEMDFDDTNQNGDLNDGGTETSRDQGIVTYKPFDVQEYGSYEIIDESQRTVQSEYSGEISTFQPPAAFSHSPTQDEESEHFEDQSIRAEPNSPRHVTGNLAHSIRDSQEALNDSPRAEQDSPRHATGNLAHSIRDAQATVNVSNLQNKSSKNVMQKKVATVLRKNTPTATLTSSSRPPNTMQSHTATTSTPSSDQNMDAIRHKLSSCITALNTKVSEKQNRSPHAPFLAYLGTKLPNVRKEQLANLEKRILDLVESCCD